jgi:hypothetical protein
MNSAVLDLARLIPPPVDGGRAATPWGDAEGQVGFNFPSDYRDFVDRYGGSGWFNNELYVIAPTTRQTDPDFGTGFQGFLDNTLIGLGRDVSEERENAIALEDEGRFPHPIFPESGGLILFAYNANGDMCFWDPKSGNGPDDWVVVVFCQAARQWVAFDGGVVDFFYAAASGLIPDIPRLMGDLEGDLRWDREFAWEG